MLLWPVVVIPGIVPGHRKRVVLEERETGPVWIMHQSTGFSPRDPRGGGAFITGAFTDNMLGVCSRCQG